MKRCVRVVLTLAAAILGVAGCRAPAAPLEAHATEPPSLPNTLNEPACVGKALQALPAATRLLALGQLDAAFGMVDQHWQACAEAQPALYEARLTSLRDLDYAAEAAQLAQRVFADPRADLAANGLARALSRTPAKVDEIARATQLTAAGALAEARHDQATAQANFDRALHAYQRATSQPPRAVALRIEEGIEAISATELLVPVQELVSDDYGVASLQLTAGPTHRLATATQLLTHGGGRATIETGVDGQFAITSSSRTLYFASRAAQPVQFPAARSVRLGRSGNLVLLRGSSVELWRAGQPNVIAEASLTTELERASLLEVSVDRRFVMLYRNLRIPGPVFAVDTERGTLPVAVADAVACDLDWRGQKLVLLRTQATLGRRKLWLELHPLDGQPPSRVLVPTAGSIANPSLSVDEDSQTVSVEVGRGRARTTHRARLADGMPAGRAARQLDPDPLSDIPVGDSDSATNLATLASLSAPPRKLVKPYYGDEYYWTENGVRSFDKQTIAVFDTGPDADSDLQLILADTSPLRLRHRLPLQLPLNSLRAFFVNDRVLMVASLGKRLWVDVKRGQIIGERNSYSWSRARVQQGDLLVAGDMVWDLSTRSNDYKIELGLGKAAALNQANYYFLEALKVLNQQPSKLRNGSVKVPSGAAPTGLYCAFGDTLADWRVCAGRFTKR